MSTTLRMLLMATGGLVLFMGACGGGKFRGKAEGSEAVLVPERVDVGEHTLLEHPHRACGRLAARTRRCCGGPQSHDGKSGRDESGGATGHTLNIGAVKRTLSGGDPSNEGLGIRWRRPDRRGAGGSASRGR